DVGVDAGRRANGYVRPERRRRPTRSGIDQVVLPLAAAQPPALRGARGREAAEELDHRPVGEGNVDRSGRREVDAGGDEAGSVGEAAGVVDRLALDHAVQVELERPWTAQAAPAEAKFPPAPGITFPHRLGTRLQLVEVAVVPGGLDRVPERGIDEPVR